MSLVIYCFLFSSIYNVPVKGEIVWYLSLTVWLISLWIIFFKANRSHTIFWVLLIICISLSIIKGNRTYNNNQPYLITEVQATQSKQYDHDYYYNSTGLYIAQTIIWKMPEYFLTCARISNGKFRWPLVSLFISNTIFLHLQYKPTRNTDSGPTISSLPCVCVFSVLKWQSSISQASHQNFMLSSEYKKYSHLGLHPPTTALDPLMIKNDR